MAVVTIDAKAELAQIQAAIDAESGQAAPAKEPEAAATEPEKKADASREPPADDDAPDFAKTLGLTPEQHKAITDIFSKKIGKKVRETREAEEFAAAQYAERKLAEARAAALEQEAAALRTKQPAVEQPQEKSKPERNTFKTDQEYLDAMIAWGIEDAMKKQAQKDAREAAERRQAEILATASERIGRALELVPDFESVTRSVDLEVPPVVAGYMQKSPMFAELGYHLAKHPDVLKSIAKLEPDEQLVTIGKIESTLKPFGPNGSKADSGATPSSTEASGKVSRETEPSAQAGTSPSKARSSGPVITPLNGTGTNGATDPADMNIREHIVDYQKRNRANFGLRKRH
jgi:hypothetical protein